MLRKGFQLAGYCLFAFSIFCSTSYAADKPKGHPAAADPNGCKDIDLSPNGDSAEANKELKKMIKESKLNNWVPSEMEACKDKDTDKMWYEFLRGLAKIESDGKSCGKCGDSESSCGLFQMTGTDSCGGKNTFGGDQQATFDYKKNIECATNEWRSIMDGSTKTQGRINTEADGSQVYAPSRMISPMGSSSKTVGNAILGNPYWGPCKRSEPKCLEIIAKVTNEICNKPGPMGGQASSGQTQPGGLAWSAPAAGASVAPAPVTRPAPVVRPAPVKRATVKSGRG